MPLPESVQKPCRRLRWLPGVVGLCLLLPLEAGEPPKEMPAAQRQAKLKERDRLLAEANKLQAADKLPEAIAAFEKALALERQLFGDSNEVVVSLQWLAYLHERRQDHTAAGKRLQEVVDIQRTRYGANDWRVTDARLALADLQLWARIDEKQQKRLVEAGDLGQQVEALYRKGRSGEAIPLAERALAIKKEVLGKKHPGYANILNDLAMLYKSMGDYGKAEPLYRQARDIRKQALGDKHPYYANSLHNLARLYYAMGDYVRAAPLDRQALAIRKEALGDKHPDYANSLNSLAALYYKLGDYGKAEPLYRQALAINKEALGEKHPDYASGLNNLAGLYDLMGDYVRAEALYRQALAIRKQALGDKHPDYAISLNSLADLYREMGDYVRAEPLYRQVLAIKKEALGEKHPAYGTSLDSLADLYESMGDYGKAEPLFRQALAIYKQALGEKHPDYAQSLNNLANLSREMGDYSKAEPLYRQALTITKEALGEKHPSYAASLHNLALLYKAMGDNARAGSLYRQALAIKKEALGEKHPAYGTSLNGLADLYKSMGDYGKAEPLFRQALAIRKQALGEKHPAYAAILNNLAALYEDTGDYTRAEPLYRQARHIFKEALGEKHPDYAASINNLSHLYWVQGDYPGAEAFLRQGLEICRNNLDLAAAAQSERQQLAMAAQLRYALNAYLALAPQAKRSGQVSYAHVLAWKGAVLARQRRLRLQRRHPELTADFSRLDRVTSRLATLALAVPDPRQQAAFRRQIQDLSEEKEQLESNLARRSAAFRQQRQAERLTPDRLQASLPADTVLVDFLEYKGGTPPENKKGQWHHEQRLAAFVVRRDSLEQLDLGPLLPISQAIDRWRGSTRRRTRPVVGEDDPAAELRRRLWQPLERHLKGARLVLVSPDGALARLPLGALPGSDPDKYLLEEVPLAVVPVPQLLPELLAADKSDAKAESSLLLVGDVDFGAAAGVAEARGNSREAPRDGRSGALLRFGGLEATREEMLAVADSFRRGHRRQKMVLTELREEEATEAAVRREATKHRYLHFATHGFFAPPELRSALAPAPARDKGPAAADLRGPDLFGRQGVSGFHPGLLSGLALAGANRPTDRDADDGILTALEVAEMDLSRVQLATLSACETGLGESAGGEGLLGLQRAFQAAGARSAVASLWKVPDQATRVLMERFYENLWDKKLTKLEALRQAQLWMLREAPKQRDLVRGLARGLDLPEDEQPHEGRPLPPYFWAAFVLSGDWR